MSTLRTRVKERVAALGSSSITLAKSVGLERGFINDIIIGRKKSVREAKLGLVAQALDCDVGYLTGHQDEVRKGNPTGGEDRRRSNPILSRSTVFPPGMAIVGVCQSGVWRSSATPPDHPMVMPVSPDARYAHVQQMAYVVRPSGERSDTVALAIERAEFERSVRPLKGGMIVVVQRRQAHLTETTMRVLRMDQTRRLVRLPDDPAAGEPIASGPSGWPSDVKIVAVVTSIVTLHR